MSGNLGFMLRSEEKIVKFDTIESKELKKEVSCQKGY